MPQKVPPDAESDDPFGTHLFGNARQIEDDWDDTDLESEFFKSLYSHIADNESEEFSKLAKKLLAIKNSGKYSKYLVPSSEPVYRFLSDVSVSKAASILGIPEKMIVNDTNEVIEVNKSFPLSDKEDLVRSWTANPYSHAISGFVNLHEKSVNIVFRVDSPGNNFILNCDTISTILLGKGSDASHLGTLIWKEKEVVSVGPVVVNKAAFYYCNSLKDKHKSTVHQHLADAITP